MNGLVGSHGCREKGRARRPLSGRLREESSRGQQQAGWPKAGALMHQHALRCRKTARQESKLKSPGPMPKVRGYQPGFASYCLLLGAVCKREFSLRIALWWLPFADMNIFL
jgi:hypothetical protein